MFLNAPHRKASVAAQAVRGLFCSAAQGSCNPFSSSLVKSGQSLKALQMVFMYMVSANWH